MATPRKDPADYLKRGRPTRYSEKLAILVCQRIASHRQSIKKICDMYDDIPTQDTINQWLRKYPEFADRYWIAKREQVNTVIDEIDEIIDENILYYTDDKDNKRIDSPSATIALAKASHKRWFAERLVPKLYGIKQATDNNNDDTLLKDSIDRKRELDDKNKKDY